MPKNLFKLAKQKKIKYFLISFVDLFGVLRSKLVPAHAIKEMQITGAGFAGFAAWLDMTPADSDMFGIPDPESLIQLPWNKEVGWLASDLWMNGKPVEASPRIMLKKQIKELAKQGFTMKSGVECEYFLISPDGTSIADPRDTQSKPCYDQSALMRRYELIKEICDCMIEMGWGPYQNDHEDANGQFEMNWEFDDTLATADKHSFFKFMTKSVAEKHGFRATFMPKPVEGLTGNGCHAHISVWDAPGSKAKTNVFATTPSTDSQTSELGLSEKGRHFLGGIMKHASAFAAITNPTVNSYKRINAPRTMSGATWAPNSVTWTGNNRTHMVRVPGPGRFELRLADGATNPYLLQAVIIAAGLSGVKSEADPGKRYDIDMYAQGHTVRGAPKLPLNMLDALRAYDKDKGLKEAMGKEFSEAYLKLKMEEWNSFVSHFSSWEKENTLDI